MFIKRIIKQLDSIAGIPLETTIPTWLERLAFIFLFLMVVTSPHSIAASQTSWLLGMIFWIARFLFNPRPSFLRTPLFVPIVSLFVWSVISALVSYAPDISMGKLRGASLFLVFFFVVNNLRSLKTVRFLALALIASCMINVLWMPVARLIGRGVEIQELSAQSPLLNTKALPGDTLLTANGNKISTPDQLVNEIERSGAAKIEVYRPDFYLFIELSRADLLENRSPSARLGIMAWKKSMNWRSAGFYGHYATYAEVLQLIASLTIGLLVAGFGMSQRRMGLDSSRDEKEVHLNTSTNKKLFGMRLSTVVLTLCVAFMALALLLTTTRAPQAALIVSAVSIFYVGAGRKMVLILIAIAIPIALAGLIFLQQSRNVGFFDSTDNSTTWRLTVYREGFDLWTRNFRNITFGVGMDSIKRFKEEWHLFDNGRLPSGHFHSTPLQLLVERGFPALLFWLWMFGIYFWKLYEVIKTDRFGNWKEKGIVLGGLGGGIGFLVSSLVHYNFGDSEVVMVLYLMMALSVATCAFTLRKSLEAAPDLQL